MCRNVHSRTLYTSLTIWVVVFCSLIAIVLASSGAVTQLSSAWSFSVGLVFTSNVLSVDGNHIGHVFYWGCSSTTFQTLSSSSLAYAYTWEMPQVVYGYGIGYYAQQQLNLGNCTSDPSTPNTLCSAGAAMLRDSTHWANILARYEAEAAGIAAAVNKLGGNSTTFPTFWALEPGLYQYSTLDTSSDQTGGGITPEDMASVYYKQIVDTILASLPAAKFGLDVTGEMYEQGNMDTWFNAFASQEVNFVFTNPLTGVTNPDGDLMDPNYNLTWTEASHILGGRGILANALYDSTSAVNNAADWFTTTNMLARHQQGVLGVTVQVVVATAVNQFLRDFPVANQLYARTVPGLPSYIGEEDSSGSGSGGSSDNGGGSDSGGSGGSDSGNSGGSDSGSGDSGSGSSDSGSGGSSSGSDSGSSSTNHTLVKYSFTVTQNDTLDIVYSTWLQYGQSLGCFTISTDGYYTYFSTSDSPMSVDVYVVDASTDGACSLSAVQAVSRAAPGSNVTVSTVSSSYPKLSCVGTYSTTTPYLLTCSDSKCGLKCGALIPCDSNNHCFSGYKCDLNSVSSTYQQCINAATALSLSGLFVGFMMMIVASILM